MKNWKPIKWSDECPECGDGVEVFTDCPDDNKACDGDEARCVGCKIKGWVVVYDENDVRINWEVEL